MIDGERCESGEARPADCRRDRELLAELQRELERSKSLLDRLPVGICRTTPDGVVLLANATMVTLLGLPPSASPATLQQAMAAQQIGSGRAELREMLARDGVVRGLEHERVGPSGEHSRVRENARIVHESDGMTITYEYTLEDVTASAGAEQALRDYAAELEMRNTELDAFAASIAHDLRNPLSTVVGFAETLLSVYDELSKEEILQAIERIARMGRKMDGMIDALLLLARIHKTAVEPVPVAMGPVVAEVLHRLGHSIDALEAEIVVPKAWPMAMGYAPWLEEVWANYISNALTYGGTPCRVELGANLVPGGRIRFWVRDNGDGVPADLRPRIFDGFATPRTSGHGMGLAIVKRIVEKLGGRVYVQSTGRPGEGSTFSFELPAALTA